MSVACSGTGTAGSCALQMPNALHQGSPRQRCARVATARGPLTALVTKHTPKAQLQAEADVLAQTQADARPTPATRHRPASSKEITLHGTWYIQRLGTWSHPELPTSQFITSLEC